MANKKPGPPPLHKKHTAKHPGFKAVEKKLMDKGMSKEKADKILGAQYWKMRAKRGGK